MDRDASRAQRLAIGAVAVFGSVLLGLGVAGSWVSLALLGIIVLFAASFFVPMVGLIVLGLMLPTYSMSIETLNNSSPFRVAGIIVFFAWCLNIMVRREQLPRFRTIDWFAMIYIVGLIMSTILTGGTIVDIATDLQLALLYVLALSVVRTFVDMRRLLIAILIGQVFMGGLATYQRHTRDFAFLNSPEIVEQFGNRACGLAHPNETGTKLGYTFPFALLFMLHPQTLHILRAVLLPGSCVMLFGLFGTQSRGGVVTLLAACLLWFIMWLLSSRRQEAHERKLHERAGAGRHVLYALLVVAVMGAFYMKYVRNQLSEDFRMRWQTMVTKDLADPTREDAGTGRMGIWKQGLKDFVASPIYGHGPKAVVGAGKAAEEGITAHNTPLEVLVRGGLLASIPFHMAFWFVLGGLWRTHHTLLQAAMFREALFAGTLLVTVLTIMFGALFGTFATDKDVWMFLALASIIIMQTRENREAFYGQAASTDLPERAAGAAKPLPDRHLVY